MDSSWIENKHTVIKSIIFAVKIKKNTKKKNSGALTSLQKLEPVIITHHPSPIIHHPSSIIHHPSSIIEPQTPNSEP